MAKSSSQPLSKTEEWSITTGPASSIILIYRFFISGWIKGGVHITLVCTSTNQQETEDQEKGRNGHQVVLFHYLLSTDIC
jgi:ubiquitin C-terminal hydrolase